MRVYRNSIHFAAFLDRSTLSVVGKDGLAGKCRVKQRRVSLPAVANATIHPFGTRPAIVGADRQQQPDVALPEHSQIGSVPRSAPLIMAVTQPTPAWIEMAAVGQFRAHAPHSMQSSRLAISAFLPTISNTAWGQTLTHIPQPIHRCWFNCSVTTFLMYFSFGMTTFSNGVHLGHSARLHESSRDPEGQSEGRRKHLCRYGDPHFPANARERCVRGRSYETHGNEAGDRWNQQCPAQHGRPTS